MDKKGIVILDELMDRSVALFKEKRYEEAYTFLLQKQARSLDMIDSKAELASVCYMENFLSLYAKPLELNIQAFMNAMNEVLVNNEGLVQRFVHDFPLAIHYYIHERLENISLTIFENISLAQEFFHHYIQKIFDFKKVLLSFLNQSPYRKGLYDCIYESIVISEKEVIIHSTRALQNVCTRCEQTPDTHHELLFWTVFFFTNEVCFDVYHDLMNLHYTIQDSYDWVIKHMQLVYNIFYEHHNITQSEGERSETIQTLLNQQRLVFNRLLDELNQLYWQKYHTNYQNLKVEIEMLYEKMHSRFVFQRKKEKLAHEMQQLIDFEEQPIIRYYQMHDYCKKKHKCIQV